jgi:uncharacterized membrane protein
MKREEFMTQLASLLQDISAEERVEAMQYYNAYFDDAGEEQEENIVEQLGSPAKVAAEVKAGLHSQDDEAAEYRETGYTDTRFEYRETPGEPKKSEYSYEGSYADTVGNNEKKPWTNKPLKIALIILVVLAALPVLGPILIGVLAAAFGIILTIAGIFIALVVAAAAIAIAGFGVTIAGGVTLFSNAASGLLVTGVGLILLVIGVIATVASIKLCTVVFPGIIRGIVFVGRKIFRRDKAVA